jgi:hypothetical protein
MKITNQEKNILVAINSFLKKYGLHIILEKDIYNTEILSFDNKDSDFVSDKPQIRYCFILKSLKSSIEFIIWKQIKDVFFNSNNAGQPSLFHFLKDSNKFKPELRNFGKNFASVNSIEEIELRLTAQGYLI